ncbi:hypothetical protein HY733_01725 [Candidatus Uhrbacteria bacterium]|nr:hypothetical protein [Candidatus Uhrbacteria bacterium]
MLPTPRDLLRASFLLYRKHLWLFVGYAAWLVIPTVPLLLTPLIEDNLFTPFLVGVFFLAQIFIFLWLTVCIMRTTVALNEHKPVEASVISSEALRRIQPVLIVAFFQVVIFFGGLLLLIIPGILFWGWYALAQISAGVDDRRPIEALTHSRSLVQGRFFAVLWRLIGGPVIIVLCYAFTLGLLLYGVAGILGLDATILFSQDPPLWQNLIQTATDVFVIPLYVVYSTLLYLALKEPSVPS